MNSGEFYKEIQRYIATLKETEMKKFVNNIIRKIPESKYEEILCIIQNGIFEISEQEIKQKI